MNNITKTIKEREREFYQHMLKATPILDKFERASLKIKFSLSNKALLESVIEMVEAEKHDDNYIICATCDSDECNANSALNNIIAHLKQSLLDLEK